ncbi:MAG: hypothetical protein HYZ79_04320 [Candidatus Melainabacteria bacterium]|nr:hypothetical protein [Candidatus Melainabacteria bacterium]
MLNIFEHNTIIYVTASLGFIHTIFGLDHYLPFIVLSKANRWSFAKTFLITALCGFAHTLSSVFIGFIGILIMQNFKKVNLVESFRGELAIWLLISIGFIYLIWGIKNAKNPQIINSKSNLVTFSMFVVFVLGPCEPLIPLMMHPQVSNHMFLLLSTVSIFVVITIFTMVCLVLTPLYTFKFLQFKMPVTSVNYAHAFAGGVIFLSGLSMKLFGL